MKARFLSGLAIAAAAFVSLKGFAAEDPGYIVHEWGTFTSVQGADGRQMAWNPLVAPELPKFVYDFSRLEKNATEPFPSAGRAAIAGKTAFTSTQRLETPVIYFYSDQNRTVDVSVNFPNGFLTEWYPNQTTAASRPGLMLSNLHWGNVHLLAGTAAKNIQFPKDATGSHYYAARETDSTPLRVPNHALPDQTEKFLFYRGIGEFTAPLTVTLGSTDSHHVTLTNNGNEELRNLFLYQVTEAGADWVKVDRLARGESIAVDLPAKHLETASLEDMAVDLKKSLVREGLYEREGAAMLKTWETSWFDEKGMRVLYTLPRGWTDRVLPLTVAPEPRETERVLVGRAEIITPEMEHALLGVTERYVAASAADRPSIVTEARALGLGRFMEPTLRRVMTSAKRSNEFSSLSWELLQAATFAPKPQAPAVN